MTKKVLKQMYQLLLTEPHAPNVCAQLERIAREALAEHAMSEVQRLGQEIEQEPTVEQIEAAIEAWFNNFKSTTYQKRMRAALKAANSIKE